VFCRKLNWKDPKNRKKYTYHLHNSVATHRRYYTAILYRRGISKIYNDEGRSEVVVVICRNLSATSDPEGNKDDFA
jgi:hypothetical protein